MTTTTTSISVRPAYGRDYRSRKAALADWEAGKDFRIYGPPWEVGRYVNINDLPAGTSVQFRYDRMTKSFGIKTGRA